MSWATKVFLSAFAVVTAVSMNKIFAGPTTEVLSMEEQVRQSRVLKVAKMGDPILAKRAQEIEEPTSPSTRSMANDMLATAKDIGDLVGLAGPQVNLSYRIVLFWVPKEEGEEVPPTLMINPTWEPISDETEQDWEGCLSVPGLVGLVPRYKTIQYTYQTLTGETHHVRATGYHARVVQHECDHLDGKLYTHRMTDMTQLFFREEFMKFHHKEQPPSSTTSS